MNQFNIDSYSQSVSSSYVSYGIVNALICRTGFFKGWAVKILLPLLKCSITFVALFILLKLKLTDLT